MVFAHGIGGAADLPIPANYAIVGGAAALVISFIVLAVAWRTPRFDAAHSGRPLPTWMAKAIESNPLQTGIRALGFLFFAYITWAAAAGPDLLVNPTFGVVYVLLWVGIVPASLVLGPFWRAVSPVRTINILLSKFSRSDPELGLRELPRWVGYWPAAGGLFAFVWLELVHPESTYLGPVRLWFALYLAILLVGSAVYGSKWLTRADPFEVYSTLVAHLSVFGRRDDGRLVFRSPLGNLDGVKAAPGLVAVVAVLLGSTAFDSFGSSNTWLLYTQETEANITLLNTVALLGFCSLVAFTFAVATMSTAVKEGVSRFSLPGKFAHSVVPIIVGYMIAHYASLLLEIGQQTIIQLSDPMATGANLLGTANWDVTYLLSTNPTFLAGLKVVAIVTGHILGIIAAHDRALKLLPKRHQLAGQLPLLLVMVFYTVGGLFLLFNS